MFPLRVLRRPAVQSVRSYYGQSDAMYAEVWKEALKDDIPTVDLVFDKHTSANPAHHLPPLVFMHGLFGSKANNRSISRQLAKLSGRDIYCVDLRNHGDSPHSERHDYPSMASDVEKFIRDHKLDSPVLVGHSMGAKAAMAVCLRQKQPLSGLIAIDNAPVDFTLNRSTGFSKFGKYIAQLQTIERMGDKMGSLKDCDRVLALVEPSLEVRQFLLTNLKKGPHGGYVCRVPLDIMKRQLENVARWPFDAAVTRSSVDALFVRGTQSHYVADEYLAAIGLFFPRFLLESIDAGHWVTAEKPAEFLQAATRFLGQIEPEE